MTFTYSGDPASSARNHVRFLLHDVDSTDPLYSDEEITFVINSWASDVYEAARELAETAIAKYARLAESTSKSVGDISVSESFADKVTHYTKLAETLARRKNRKQAPRPWASASNLTSTARRNDATHNTDFYEGIMDNPNNYLDRRIVE